MREGQFKDYLLSLNLGEKGIVTRMTKGRKAENILGKSLDNVVADDRTMYDALVQLQAHENPRNNPMQNVVRHYYKFCNGRDFPSKKEYELQNGLTAF